MPTLEQLLQEAARRGIDPNQISQAPANFPIPTDPASAGDPFHPQPDISSGLFSDLRKNWPQYAGGAAAGAVGAATFGPDPSDLVTVPAVYSAVTKALGGSAAAALGGASGKGYQQAAQMFDNYPGAPVGFGEIYKEQGKAALEEGLSELAGHGIGWAGGKAIAPLKGKLIPGAQRFDAKLRAAGELIPEEILAPKIRKFKHARKWFGLGKKMPAVGLTPAEMTSSPILDWAENFVQGAIFGGGRFHNWKKVLRPEAIKVLTKQMNDELWQQAGRRLTPAEVGELFVNVVTDKGDAANRLVGGLFKDIDDASFGMAKVDFSLIRQSAEELRDETLKLAGFGDAPKLLQTAEKAMQIQDADFMLSHKLRSKVLQNQRLLEGELQSKLPDVNRVTTKLVKQIDDAMEAAAKNHSEGLWDMLLNANAATKQMYNDILSNEHILKLLKKEPQAVASALFKPDAINPVLAVKKVVDDQTWKTLVASHMDEIVKKASKALPGDFTDDIGVIRGRQFVDKMMSLGDDVLMEMFESKEHIENVLDVGRIAFATQSSAGRGGGGMVVQLMQAAGIVGLFSGVMTAESGAILIGPAAMSRLMASPAGTKWLSIGFKTMKGTPQAAAAMARLVNIARKTPGIEMKGFDQPTTIDKTKFPFGGKSDASLFPKGFPSNPEQMREDLLLKTSR